VKFEKRLICDLITTLVACAIAHTALCAESSTTNSPAALPRRELQLKPAGFSIRARAKSPRMRFWLSRASESLRSARRSPPGCG
jgi:hypothetical protein